MVEHQLHNQTFIESLTELIHANLGDENFGAKELAEAAGLSQRKLSQNLRSIKKSSVSRFICETRLRKALELLLEADMTAAEVAYKVGFGSATYFNKCFHDFFGYPPGKMRKGENNCSGVNPEEKDFRIISRKIIFEDWHLCFQWIDAHFRVTAYRKHFIG